VIGDARRGSFFFALISEQELVGGPTLHSESEMKMKLDTLEPAMAIFSSELLPQFDRAVVRYPSALVLARVAREPQRGFHFPPLEPIYLREPHITMPKPGT
jgi:tRNA A37 threonylcarbamoyladenosine modification protein TsaB